MPSPTWRASWLVGAEQELLAGLAPGVEGAAHLGAAEASGCRAGRRTPGRRARPGRCIWSMMLYRHLGQAVDVGLAGPEVAALHRVVEEAEDAVAVALVVLRGVDAALGGDRVGPAGRVVEGEGLHVVALLAERGRGRAAGQPGAHDDDVVLAPVGRVHQLPVELVVRPTSRRWGRRGSWSRA